MMHRCRLERLRESNDVQLVPKNTAAFLCLLVFFVATNPSSLDTFSRRIVAAFEPWVAAKNSVQPSSAAGNESVFLDRLNEVGTARRLKAAVAAEHWTDGKLIEPNDQDHQQPGQPPDPQRRLGDQLIHSRSPSLVGWKAGIERSKRSVSFLIDRAIAGPSQVAPFFGRTTRSSPTGRFTRCFLNASRI